MSAEDGLLTVPQTAKRLGCSENTVYRLVADGSLRAVDIKLAKAKRSRTRVRADDLAAFIDSRTRRVAS